MWNEDNAIYDDGEWITWTEINSHLARLEFEARFPNLDVDLVPIFQDLLAVAQNYYELTGIRHNFDPFGWTNRNKPSPSASL